MNMTPKNILKKFTAVPIYSTSGVVAMAGLFFLVPGGIFVLGALLLCYLGDWIVKRPFDDHIDTSIEEYEQYMTDEDYSADPDVRDNCDIWNDFYGGDDDAN